MRVKHFPDIPSVKLACERAVALARAKEWRISTLSSQQLAAVLQAAGFQGPSGTELACAVRRYEELVARPRRKGDQVTIALLLELVAAACGYPSWNTLMSALSPAPAVAEAGLTGTSGAQIPASDRFARNTMHAVNDGADAGPANQWRQGLWEEFCRSPDDLPTVLIRLAAQETASPAPPSSVQVHKPWWVREWAHATADLCRTRFPILQNAAPIKDGAALLAQMLADLTDPDTYIKHLETFLSDEQGQLDLQRATPALQQFSVTQLIIARAASFKTTSVQRFTRTAIAMQFGLAKEFEAVRALRQNLFAQAGVVRLA